MNLATFTLILVSIIALPFSLYMLFVLYRYEKKGWIIGFVVWMGISFIPFFFLPNNNLLLIALKFSPLLFFVFYTIVLKEKVGEWLMKMEFEKQKNRLIYSKKDL
jgi:hypothetical protein